VRAVHDVDPRRDDVPLEGSHLADLHALGAEHVAHDAPDDLDVLGGDLGADLGVGADDQVVILEVDLPLDLPLDRQVLVSRDLALTQTDFPMRMTLLIFSILARTCFQGRRRRARSSKLGIRFSSSRPAGGFRSSSLLLFHMELPPTRKAGEPVGVKRHPDRCLRQAP
jgi:hypothetical protein